MSAAAMPPDAGAGGAVTPSAPPRFRSLDGLRGVAALIVVVYHALLVAPSFSSYYLGESDPSFASIEWWLVHTPLRLLFAGHEAVLVFFVLSGFVLTLPLVKSNGPWLRRRGWSGYYVRRLIRLYIPVWASLVVAFAVATAVQRNTSIGSGWLTDHHQPTLRSAANDALLLLGTSNLNSPLWSLRWEIWFSLLLPVMYFAVRLVRAERWWPGAIVILAAISAVSHAPAVAAALPVSWLTVGLLEYLPVFGIGMVLALRVDALRTIARRVGTTHRSGRIWAIVTATSLVVTLSPTFTPGTRGTYDLVGVALAWASLIGVVGLVFSAMHAPRVVGFLERRSVQWTGSRSFSLYLIHEPILVALALLVHADGWLPWLFIAAGAVPLILLAAEAFYRLVEHPSHLLSRRAGVIVDTLSGRRRRTMIPIPAVPVREAR